VSLTTGRGPLSSRPAGRFSVPVPTGVVYVEPHPRRIQAMVGERAVIDTERALLVHRPDRTLSYAFLPDDVHEVAAEPEPDAPGYVRVPWDAADAWYEEGRRLVNYPPNPYHRVDCRPTTRRLRVTIAGTTFVDTDDTVILFETALAPRLYVAPALVRTDLLRPSATATYCNYKGHATWWSAVVGDVVVDDVAWSYEEPLPESSPITGYLCFDPERADLDIDAEMPRSG
jgi:uncharacterized protein (DUF427 family)